MFAIVRLILLKFRMAKDMLLPKLMSNPKFGNCKIQVDRRRPTRKLRKISIYFYSLPKNSEESENNRFHAKLVIFSNFYDIFANIWPIFDDISRDKAYSLSQADEWPKVWEL